MNKPIVCIKDLVKTYRSGNELLRILNNLDVEIPEGCSAAVRGESGSGKSTLLNILGGLDTCDSGSLKVGSFQLESLSEKALTQYRRFHIGFIFQFHYLLKDFTALENILLPAYMAGVSRKEATKRANELLEEVKLDNRAHHFPSQLSGGERQRVAVARSLVNDPVLILADEPTGNLDPKNSAIVSDLLYSCAEKRGKTLLLVTHDEGVAEKAQLQLFLQEGRFIKSVSHSREQL